MDKNERDLSHQNQPVWGGKTDSNPIEPDRIVLAHESIRHEPPVDPIQVTVFQETQSALLRGIQSEADSKIGIDYLNGRDSRPAEDVRY